MKKKLLSFSLVILIIISCCSCKATATVKTDATENSSKNQGLTVSSQFHMVDFDGQNPIQAIEYVFPNGTKMYTSEGNAKTIVMINGTYNTDMEVRIIDDLLMVPIKDLCDSLNITAIAESDAITINNDDVKITFTVNDKVVLVNDKKSTLATPPKIIKNTIYVPLAFIYDKLGLTVAYYDPSEKICLFAWNPIITIDQKSNLPYLSEDEAYKYLKNNLNEASNHFKENFKKLNNPDDNRLYSMEATLKEDINNLKIVGNISKYYIFEGLDYTIFLDKYNKDVYFHVPTISTLNTKKIDFNDTNLFEYSYMVD